MHTNLMNINVIQGERPDPTETTLPESALSQPDWAHPVWMGICEG